MAVARDQRRSLLLSRITSFLAAVLFAKVLVSVLYEYRWYFPANFVESSFLLGRQDNFYGTYAVAFHTHIASGPIAISLGAFLISNGARTYVGSIDWSAKYNYRSSFCWSYPAELFWRPRH